MSDDGKDIDINFSELIGNILSSHTTDASNTDHLNQDTENVSDTENGALLPEIHKELELSHPSDAGSGEQLIPTGFEEAGTGGDSGVGGGLEDEELARVMTAAMQHLNTEWDTDVHTVEGQQEPVLNVDDNDTGDLNMDLNFGEEEQQREWAQILHRELMQHDLEEDGHGSISTGHQQQVNEGSHVVSEFPSFEQEQINQLIDEDKGNASEDEDLRRAILESLKVLSLDTEDTMTTVRQTQKEFTKEKGSRRTTTKSTARKSKVADKGTTNDTTTSSKTASRAKPKSRTKPKQKESPSEVTTEKPKKSTKKARTKTQSANKKGATTTTTTTAEAPSVVDDDVLNLDELIRGIIQQTIHDETESSDASNAITTTALSPKIPASEASNDAETQAIVEATLKAFEHELFQPSVSTDKETPLPKTAASKAKAPPRSSRQKKSTKETKSSEVAKKKKKTESREKPKKRKPKKGKESLEIIAPGIDDEFSKVLADMVNRVVHTTISDELPEKPVLETRNKRKSATTTRRKRTSTEATTKAIGKEQTTRQPGIPNVPAIPSSINDEALDLNQIMQNAMALALQEQDDKSFDSSVIDDFHRGLGSFDVSEILSSVTEPGRIPTSAATTTSNGAAIGTISTEMANDSKKAAKKKKKKKKDKDKEKVRDKRKEKKKKKKEKKSKKDKTLKIKATTSERSKSKPIQLAKVTSLEVSGGKEREKQKEKEQQPSGKEAAEVITELHRTTVPHIDVQLTRAVTTETAPVAAVAKKKRKSRSKAKQPSAITVQKAKEARERIERKRRERAEKKEREKQILLLRRIPRPDKILKLRRARERAIRKEYKTIVTEAAKIARRRLRSQKRVEQEKLREERRERRLERRRLKELEVEKLEAEQKELAEIVARGPPYPPDLRLTKKGVPKKPYRRWTPEEMAQRALLPQTLSTNKVKKPKKEKLRIKKVKKLKRIPLSVLKKIPLLNFAKVGVSGHKIQLNDIEGTLSKIQLPNGLGTANNLSKSDIKKLIKIQRSRYFDPTVKTVVRKEKFAFHPPWSIPDHPPLALPVARRKVKNLYKKLKGRIGSTKFTGGYNLAKESIYLNSTNKLEPAVLLPIIKTLKAVARAKIAKGFSAEETMRHLVKIVDRTKKAIAEAIFAAMRRRHTRNISPKLPIHGTRDSRNVVNQSSLGETISRIPIFSLSKIKEIQRKSCDEEEGSKNVVRPVHTVQRIKIEPELQMRLLMQSMNKVAQPTKDTKVKQEVKTESSDSISTTDQKDKNSVSTEKLEAGITNGVVEASDTSGQTESTANNQDRAEVQALPKNNSEISRHPEGSIDSPDSSTSPTEEDAPSVNSIHTTSSIQPKSSVNMQGVNKIEGCTPAEYISCRLFGSIAYPQLTPKLIQNTGDNTSNTEQTVEKPSVQLLPSPPTSASSSLSTESKKEAIKPSSQQTIKEEAVGLKKEVITIKEEEDEDTKSLGLLKKVKILPLVAPPRKLSTFPLMPYKPTRVDVKPTVKPLSIKQTDGSSNDNGNHNLQDDVSIPSHLTKIITSTISDLIPKIERRENSKLKEERRDPNKVLNLDGLVPPPFYGARSVQRIKRTHSSSSSLPSPIIDRPVAKPVVKPAKTRKLRERAAEKPVLKYKFNIPDFSEVAGKKTIVLKRAKKYLNEKELVVLKRELNKERKRKWREVNVVRNWKHDLRARLRKRSNALFGAGESAEKEKWVEQTFTIKCEESGYDDKDYNKVGDSNGSEGIEKNEKVSNLNDQEVLNIIADTMGRLDIAHRIEAELNEEMRALLEPKPNKRRKLNDGVKAVKVHAGMNSDIGFVL